jgi:DNA-binding protein H-NS
VRQRWYIRNCLTNPEIPMTKLSLDDLLAQKAALEKQIADTQRAERADAVAQVRALMAQYGLSLADIGAKSGRTQARGTGAKVAAKYRDPATGNAWSGRG